MARILIAGYCALPGPDRAGVQLGHVVRELSRHHSVDVLCLRRGDQAYVERRGSARILRVPVSDADSVARIETFRRALRRQLEGADYDAVVARDAWAGVPALEARGALQFAFVFDAARSPMAEASKSDPQLVQLAEQGEDTCLREADMVLAPTEAARQYLASRCRPERVHTVPVGVDVDLFDWDDPVSMGAPVIVCAGSFRSGHAGLDVLLPAMAAVAASSPAVLTLVGGMDPEVRAAASSAIERLGLGARVNLAGEVDHRRMPEILARASVCVAPAAVELSPRPTTLFPTRLLEYLACRRPVVAPRAGTVTLLLRDRQHALLFSPGDPASLATQLQRLVAEPELGERLAKTGYEMVRRAHTASATRRSLRRAFSWLATQGPWAERWHRTEEVADADVVPIGISSDAEVTESVALAEEPVAQADYTGPDTFFDADDTSEPEDHTMVEPGAVVAISGDGTDNETVESSLSAGGDDWMVPERSVSDSIQSRFVAGEVDVGGPPPIPPSRPAEPEFTAMSPLLGTSTRTRASPAPRRKAASKKPEPSPPPAPRRVEVSPALRSALSAAKAARVAKSSGDDGGGEDAAPVNPPDGFDAPD